MAAGKEGRYWSGGTQLCRGQQNLMWAGGLALASSASLQSPDGKQACCFLPMFGVSPNDPSLGQLQEGQWQNWSCAERTVPRE